MWCCGLYYGCFGLGVGREIKGDIGMDNSCLESKGKSPRGLGEYFSVCEGGI